MWATSCPPGARGVILLGGAWRPVGEYQGAHSAALRYFGRPVTKRIAVKARSASRPWTTVFVSPVFRAGGGSELAPNSLMCAIPHRRVAAHRSMQAGPLTYT